MSGSFGMIRTAAAVSIAVLGLVAPQLAVPALAQTPLIELPSVADLADRLLPAVVEITIETNAKVSAAPKLPEDRKAHV